MSDQDPRVPRRSVLYGTAGALSAVGVAAGRPRAIGVATAEGDHDDDHDRNRLVCVGAEDGSIYGIDAERGEAVWTITEPDDAVSSSPTAVGGTVYVGSADGQLYAIDAADGTITWTANPEAGPIVSSPTVIDDTLYVGSGSGDLLAIDRTTGDRRWRFDGATGTTDSAPAVTADGVYLGSDAGEVFALDPVDGTVRWERVVGDPVIASPTVVDGTLYVGSFDERIYAIDTESGSVAWDTDLGDIVFSSAAVVGGTVYVGTAGFGTGLHALDADTGERRWTADGPAGVVSSPTVVDGTVYVGSVDGQVHAIDSETGDAVGDPTPLGDQVNSSPTVFDDTLYVGSTDQAVHAVDTTTGEPRWRFDEPDDDVFSSPTVVDVAGDGHGVGSRAELGTLGHHHVWAGVPFGGGSNGSTGGSGDTGSEDGDTERVDDDDGGSDPSDVGGDTGTVDDDGEGGSVTGTTAPAPGAGLGIGPLELVGAAGGVGVAALAAYRFFGGSDGVETTPSRPDADTPTVGDSPPQSPQSSQSPEPAEPTEPDRSDDTDESGTNDAGRTETGSGVNGGTSDRGSASEPGSVPERGSASKPDATPEMGGDGVSAATPTAPDESPQTEGSDGSAGSVSSVDTSDLPTESYPTGAAFVSAIGSVTDANPVETDGPLAVYAVTDDLIAEESGRAGGDDGRIIALPDGDDETGERFGTVATDWGSVSHYDGTVTVYDTGSDPVPWILTDPAHRVPTLAEHLADPPDPIVDRLAPVVDAAEALSQASRYTVRHYYLSPSHVRVLNAGSDPSGVVDDWGLSAIPAYADRGTRDSSPYTAPEQLPGSDDPLWRGKPDTYALGAIAYHAATGEPPTDDRPPEPSGVADVPAAIDRPILRALDPDPDERHGSVGGFARALRLAVFD